MGMGAGVAIGTAAAEVVDVAHFHLFDAVDSHFVVFDDGVDALAETVAGDGWGAWSGGFCRWRRRDDGG